MASADALLLRSIRRFALLALLAVAAASCGKEPTAPVVEPPPTLTPEAELANRLQQGWATLTPGLRGVSVAVLTRDDKLYTATVGASAPWPNSPALSATHRFRVASVSKSFMAALAPAESDWKASACSGLTSMTAFASEASFCIA